MKQRGQHEEGWPIPSYTFRDGDLFTGKTFNYETFDYDFRTHDETAMLTSPMTADFTKELDESNGWMTFRGFQDRRVNRYYYASMCLPVASSANPTPVPPPVVINDAVADTADDIVTYTAQDHM